MAARRMFAPDSMSVYCYRMERNQISDLLRKIRTIQWFSLSTQIALLCASAIVIRILAGKVQEKYLWNSPGIVWLTAGAILLFLGSKTIAWFSSRTERNNASELDRRYALKERVSTYVELKNSNHPFLQPLIHETSVKLVDVSPLRASGAIREVRLPATILAIFVLPLLVLPYLPVPQTILSKKKEQQRLAEAAKEMEQFANELQKKQAQTPELKKLAAELQKVAQELQKPETDKAEALKKLNALEEKQKNALSEYQKKLTADLQKAADQAANAKPNHQAPSAQQTAEMEKLAAELKQALEGKPNSGKEGTENLQTQNLSSKEIQKLKDALKNYQDKKAQADQMRSELKNSLENTRKSASSGKSQYTSDSKLKDRDVEKGKGGVEDGPGTTNQDSGPSRFDPKKKGDGKYMEDRTKAEYERMYDGQRENAGKDPLYLESQWNEEGDPQYTNVRSFGLEKESTASSESGKAGRQNQGESAVRKERVPPSHEKIVKEYFEAIEE